MDDERDSVAEYSNEAAESHCFTSQRQSIGSQQFSKPVRLFANCAFRIIPRFFFSLEYECLRDLHVFFVMEQGCQVGCGGKPDILPNSKLKIQQKLEL
jgi:hypothetical protein